MTWNLKIRLPLQVKGNPNWLDPVGSLFFVLLVFGQYSSAVFIGSSVITAGVVFVNADVG